MVFWIPAFQGGGTRVIEFTDPVSGDTTQYTIITLFNVNGSGFIIPVDPVTFQINPNEPIFIDPAFHGQTFEVVNAHVSGGGTLPQSQARIVCFTRGTRIITPRGPVAVEDLKVGDLVMTKDNGPQPVRWIGSRRLTQATLRDNPNLKPIRIAKNALGRGLPESDLIVSPQHRILLRSKVAERMFGTSEVLVAAKKLLTMRGIEVVENTDSVEYFHFLCDRHELVWSEGTVTETLHTGPEAMKTLSQDARDEILEIFPELSEEEDISPRETARLTPLGKDVRKMLSRISKNGKHLCELTT